MIITLALVYSIIAFLVFVFNFIIYIRSWQRFLRDDSFSPETRHEYYRNYFCSWEYVLSNNHFWYVANLNHVFIIAIIWPLLIVVLITIGFFIIIGQVIKKVIDFRTKCRNHIITRLELFMFSGINK